MANTKISALTSATTPLVGTEVLPIVQSGVTVKVANNDLRPKQIQSNATSGVMQIVGPAAAATRVMTIPDANFVVARTDTAQSFTGDQTLSTGNLIFGTASKGLLFSGGNGLISVNSASYNIYIGGGTYTPNETHINATYTFLDGVYADTTASAANMYITSGKQIQRSTSALKYKQDVRDLEEIDVGLLRPVRYKSKCEIDDQTKDHFGIIADEAHAAGLTELVTYGADGEIEGFQYERLTVVLLKKIQLLESRISRLEKNNVAD